MALASAIASAAAPSASRPAASQPQALLWPLDFDDGLASSFGELRGDRFHTGIDLRTRGETGWPVHASAAGRVVRLKEEWRGYGLALYLEHAQGGLLTVYGHLDRVAPDLEAKLAAARRARGSRYGGDVEVTPPRAVTAGEVVAWTGETGAGLPHLHLEVRQGMDRPVDPFRAGLAPPRDELPPVAEQLVLEPGAPGATVNGKEAPLVIELRSAPGARGAYRALERPVVRGPVALALRAYDRCGAENWAGLGGLSARLDGQEVYRLRFDAIPFASSQTAGVVLDLGRSHIGPSYYTYRIGRLPGSELPFASGGTTPVTLAPGLHRLEIELEGMVATAGNRSRVTLDLAAEALPGAGATPPPAIPARIAEGPFALALGAGDLYGPVAITAVKVAEASLPPLPAGLELLAPAVRVGPAGWPLKSPVEAAFGLAKAPREAGVYELDAYDGSWGLEDMGTTASVRHLGTWALLADRAAPSIERIMPSDGAEVAPGEVPVEVGVKDIGSGIPERGIAITADGVPLDVTYDPDRARATARFEAAAGEHTLVVRVTDRAGNAAERTARVRAAGR